MQAHLEVAARAYQIEDINIMPTLTAFDRASARYEADGNIKAYAQSLWYLLKHRGYQVKRGYEFTTAKDVKTKMYHLAKDALWRLVSTAPDLSRNQYESLSNKLAVTTAESAACLRFAVYALFGRVTKDTVEQFQRGKTTRQLKKFMMLGDYIKADEDGAVIAGQHISLSRFDEVTKQALRTFLDLLGLDSELSTADEAEFDGARVLKAFHTMKKEHRAEAKALQRAGIASFDGTPSKPMLWLSNFFKRNFSLTFNEIGRFGSRGNRSYWYRVNTEIDRTKQGKLKTLGLNIMRNLADRFAKGLVSNHGIESFNSDSTPTLMNHWKAELGAMLRWLTEPDDSLSDQKWSNAA